MVWIRSLENNYVNVDKIISIAYDKKCNSFVAVVGYRDNRLQHKIYHPRPLDSLLQGTPPRSETDIIEKIVMSIEEAKRNSGPDILDFNTILADFKDY